MPLLTIDLLGDRIAALQQTVDANEVKAVQRQAVLVQKLDAIAPALVILGAKLDQIASALAAHDIAETSRLADVGSMQRQCESSAGLRHAALIDALADAMSDDPVAKTRLANRLFNLRQGLPS